MNILNIFGRINRNKYRAFENDDDMAKFIEVISGEYKGLRCFVRSGKKEEDFYKTFDNMILRKNECKVLDYEKDWIGEKDPGCRYRE